MNDKLDAAYDAHSVQEYAISVCDSLAKSIMNSVRFLAFLDRNIIPVVKQTKTGS